MFSSFYLSSTSPTQKNTETKDIEQIINDSIRVKPFDCSTIDKFDNDCKKIFYAILNSNRKILSDNYENYNNIIDNIMKCTSLKDLGVLYNNLIEIIKTQETHYNSQTIIEAGKKLSIDFQNSLPILTIANTMKETYYNVENLIQSIRDNKECLLSICKIDNIPNETIDIQIIHYYLQINVKNDKQLNCDETVKAALKNNQLLEYLEQYNEKIDQLNNCKTSKELKQIIQNIEKDIKHFQIIFEFLKDCNGFSEINDGISNIFTTIQNSLSELESIQKVFYNMELTKDIKFQLDKINIESLKPQNPQTIPEIKSSEFNKQNFINKVINQNLEIKIFNCFDNGEQFSKNDKKYVNTLFNNNNKELFNKFTQYNNAVSSLKNYKTLEEFKKIINEIREYYSSCEKINYYSELAKIIADNQTTKDQSDYIESLEKYIKDEIIAKQKSSLDSLNGLYNKIEIRDKTGNYSEQLYDFSCKAQLYTINMENFMNDSSSLDNPLPDAPDLNQQQKIAGSLVDIPEEECLLDEHLQSVADAKDDIQIKKQQITINGVLNFLIILTYFCRIIKLIIQ